MRQILISMNLHAEKLKLIEWIVGLKDISTIQKVAEVRIHTITEGLAQISTEELQARALESEEAIKRGDITTLEALKAEMKTW